MAHGMHAPLHTFQSPAVRAPRMTGRAVAGALALSASWWALQCVADEPSLGVGSPLAGDTLYAGHTYAITWTGGGLPNTTVRVYARINKSATLVTGYGLPAGEGQV